MQISKYLFRFSLISSTILLIVSTIMELYATCDILKYIEGITLNVFAGTIVMVATSFMDYQIQKKKTIISIQEKIIEIENLFKKVDYMNDIGEYPQYEDYKKYYQNHEPPIIYTEDNYNIEKNIEYTNKYMKDFEKIIEQYIELSKIDLNGLWRLFDDLHFLWPIFGKDKLKDEFNNDIFEYIKEKLKKIESGVYHFNEYKNNKASNFKVNYKILLELQKEVFYHEKTIGHVTDWLDNHNKEFIKRETCNPIDDSNTITYNIVAEYLDNKWKELGKYK